MSLLRNASISILLEREKENLGFHQSSRQVGGNERMQNRGSDLEWKTATLFFSVSVIMYNRIKNVLIFVRQFRPGTALEHFSRIL